MQIISTLSVLMVLLLLNSQAAEHPEDPRENVVVIGSPPRFGTLDGVRFERRTVRYVTSYVATYICVRDRQTGDFKIGERVHGNDMPVTDIEPQGVIHRIIVESPAGGDKRSYLEVPPELYRDLSEHNVGEPTKPPQTLFSLARKGSKLIVFLDGGDAAGSYTANWIIDLVTARVRRVIADGEQDEGPLSPWLKLKKIEKPNIEISPDQDGQQAGADQPATKPADKPSVKDQPSNPTPKDGPR